MCKKPLNLPRRGLDLQGHPMTSHLEIQDPYRLDLGLDTLILLYSEDGKVICIYGCGKIWL